jgi:hypothetical protein
MIGRISFGTALVIGKNLVPIPPQGITALVIFFIINTSYFLRALGISNATKMSCVGLGCDLYWSCFYLQGG